jgi:hypothetical protein
VTRAERKRRRDREHELDRMVAAAVSEQAKAGHGFRFEIPESVRRLRP